MIKLKEYVVVKNDNKLIYFMTYRKCIKIKNSVENMSITKKIIEGTTQEELVKMFDSIVANEIYECLNRNSMISFFVNDSINSIEERFLYYLEQYDNNPKKLYKRLNGASICIVGLGGIGGNILQVLVSSGIRNFVLIDYDKVEYSNLNRQFFYTAEDVGTKKVEVCLKKIRNIDKNIKCEIYDKKIETENDLDIILQNKRIDVIVCSADTPTYIREIINNVASDKKSAFCYGGLGIDYGIYTIKKPKTYKIVCRAEKDEDYLNYNAPLGSSGASNAIISSFMAYDIINYILQVDTWCGYNIVGFDFKKMILTKKHD